MINGNDAFDVLSIQEYDSTTEYQPGDVVFVQSLLNVIAGPDYPMGCVACRYDTSLGCCMPYKCGLPRNTWFEEYVLITSHC